MQPPRTSLVQIGAAARRSLPTVAGAEPVQRPAAGQTSLLTLEDELAAAIPESERSAADRLVRVAYHRLGPGPWAPCELYAEPEPMGMLVLSGAVCRETGLGDRVSAQLFGPGAIIAVREPPVLSLPWQTHWSSVVESVVAVLDNNFPSYIERWPAVGALIQRRLAVQFETATCLAAIARFPRVDERIIALFWHLADVWGTVGHDGVTITLPLTHRLIGRLVGAERATVSLALTRLADLGLLSRTTKRTWSLAHNSLLALVQSGSLEHGAGVHPEDCFDASA